jgi:hypothetical protein
MPDCLGYLRANCVACEFPSKLPHFKSIWRPRRKVNTPYKERNRQLFTPMECESRKQKKNKGQTRMRTGGECKAKLQTPALNNQSFLSHWLGSSSQ